MAIFKHYAVLIRGERRRLKNIFFEACNSIKKSKWIYPLFFIIIGHIIISTLVILPKISEDSLEYMSYSFTDFMHLRFTSGRTPLYPLIIRICLYVCGEGYYLYVLVVLQWIASFVGIVYFYKIAAMHIYSQKILFCLTVAYGMSPVIWGWNCYILTESFALTGTMIYLYMILNYIFTGKFEWGIRTLIFTFFLVFLRPTFLLFYILTVGFFVLRYFFSSDSRINCIKYFVTSLGLGIFILFYCYIFSLQHGIFSLADSLPRQKLIVCINGGYYKASSNEKFVSMIDEGLATQEPDPWVLSTMKPVLEYFGNNQVNKLTTECIWLRRNEYIKDIAKLALSLSYSDLDGCETKREDLNSIQVHLYRWFDEIISVGTLKIGYIYIIIGWEFLILMVIKMRKKQLDWVHLGLLIFMFSITLSTYMATCAEYMRTMIHIVPFMWISILFIIVELKKGKPLDTELVG